MNTFKAVVATPSFWLACLLFGLNPFNLPLQVWIVLFISGGLGLAIGDIFLMRSYAQLGPGRTLMIFAFQPLVLAGADWLFFEERLRPILFLALLCLIGCVLMLSLESSRSGRGHWSVKSFGAAALAASFDAGGIALTKEAFRDQPGMHSFEANAVRCLGALIVLYFINQKAKMGFRQNFKKLTKSDKTLAIVASFFGVFMSLTFWLRAISLGKLGVISAVGGIGPLYTSALEAIIDRRMPRKPFFAALAFFILGFLILSFPDLVTDFFL